MIKILFAYMCVYVYIYICTYGLNGDMLYIPNIVFGPLAYKNVSKLFLD